MKQFPPRPSTEIPPMDREAIRRAVELALPGALERAQIMADIRVAMLKGDHAAALRLLSQYLGIPTVQVTS